MANEMEAESAAAKLFSLINNLCFLLQNFIRTFASGLDWSDSSPEPTKDQGGPSAPAKAEENGMRSFEDGASSKTLDSIAPGTPKLKDGEPGQTNSKPHTSNTKDQDCPSAPAKAEENGMRSFEDGTSSKILDSIAPGTPKLKDGGPGQTNSKPYTSSTKDQRGPSAPAKAEENGMRSFEDGASSKTLDSIAPGTPKLKDGGSGETNSKPHTFSTKGQGGPSAPTKVEENGMRSFEDGASIKTLASSRPRTPKPKDGGPGQINSAPLNSLTLVASADHEMMIGLQSKVK